VLDPIFLKSEFVKGVIFVHPFYSFQILRVAHLTFKNNDLNFFPIFQPLVWMLEDFHKKLETTEDTIGS